jgi:CDP-diglyceride synthetase
MSYYPGPCWRKHPVLHLILLFVEITVHRRGPDQLPSSQFFFLLVLGVSVCVDLLVLLVDDFNVRGVFVTLLTTALDLAFVWAVLRTFDRVRRFKQTMSALLGVNALLSLLIVPLALWSRSLDVAEGEVALPWLFLLLLAIWSIDIAGFVLARALDRPYALGVAIMLGYVLLSVSLQQSLLPVAS